MANTGWVNPGTVESDDSTGTLVWSDPDNAKSSNDSYATNDGDYETTEYLKATNFGFNIPTGSTVDGVQVSIERKASGDYGVGGLGEDVKIVKSNGSIGSTNKGVSEYWTTSELEVDYGGSSDLWGETWSASDINNSNFGAALSLLIENYASAQVDHIQIKVHYTEPELTTGSSDKGLYISGAAVSSSERNIYLRGSDSGTEQRGVYLQGSDSDSDERSLYIEGKIESNSERGLYINGKMDGSVLYKNLQITNDNSAIRNRIYVRGGTYLSDTFTMEIVADGESTVFNLPEKPHDLTVTEGATSKTVGTKYIHEFADYDYLLNYQEKYVETEAAPAADTVITFTFKYNIPVLIAIEDPDSIEDHGQAEFAIFDKNISTITQARDRATAELTDYAETVIGGRFQTETDGFKAGQYMQITNTAMGVDEEFLVQRVVANSIGGGNFVYTVYVTSATVLGIIQFLVNLLEGDKNILEISSDEVVDEIKILTGEEFTLSDETPSLVIGDGTFVYYEDDVDDGEYDLASFKPT